MRRLPSSVLVLLACVLLVPLAWVTPASADPGHDVKGFGSVSGLGAPSSLTLQAPLVGIASSPAVNGYWLLGADGGVFTYGGARFYGSTGNRQLNAAVVGIAATRTGHGYWLVASDGGVFAFGDAHFYGSTGAIRLAQPVVGMAVTTTGRGYWLVAQDGGVFAFGDARFRGSLGATPGAGKFVGIAAAPGGGYSLVADSGAVFGFGGAPSFHTAGAGFLSAPVVGMQLDAAGDGAWVLGADGAVYAYGHARYLGGAYGPPITAVGIARAPRGDGYWVAVAPGGEPVPANSGSGRRIVYSNSMQRVWLVEAAGYASHSWLVSGRRGVPAPGTYHVFSKDVTSYAGSLLLPYMTRFAWGHTAPIGFHGVPLEPNGRPIQSDAELGQFRSHGCVRMNQDAIKVLYAWAPIGTTVVVLP